MGGARSGGCRPFLGWMRLREKGMASQQGLPPVMLIQHSTIMCECSWFRTKRKKATECQKWVSGYLLMIINYLFRRVSKTGIIEKLQAILKMLNMNFVITSYLGTQDDRKGASTKFTNQSWRKLYSQTSVQSQTAKLASFPHFSSDRWQLGPLCWQY